MSISNKLGGPANFNDCIDLRFEPRKNSTLAACKIRAFKTKTDVFMVHVPTIEFNISS